MISEDCGIEMGTKGVIRKRKCNQRNKNDLLKSYYMIFPFLTVIIVSGGKCNEDNNEFDNDFLILVLCRYSIFLTNHTIIFFSKVIYNSNFRL